MERDIEMVNHHFISYSTVDAEDFAIQLCDKLKAGPPSFSAWLDKRELKPGPHWDDQVVEAIRNCDSLIFVMSRDSVRSRSVCKNEWSRAMKYKRTIIPILLHEDAEIPFQLENRQYIDCVGDFDTALAKLRDHLQRLKSPEGKLQTLKDRLMDAEGDLQRTDDPKKTKRIQKDIETLKMQVSEQEQIVLNPDKVAQRVQENIDRGLDRERQPEKPKSGVTKTKFINPPPGVAPTYWQDRYHETELVGQFLENDVERLITVVGRGGVGKTAMVCRLLKSLQAGRLPENSAGQNEGKELKVDGIVYLNERGSRKVNFPDLYFDLCRLLPDEVAQELDEVYKDATTSTAEKMKALLRDFPKGRFVVLLDNFEDKVDAKTLAIEDENIKDALTALLTSEPHAVKVILTTRIAPRSLALVEPAKQRRLDLNEGLDSPYAENILREMDTDGKVGLKEASDELLDEARKRTNGYPRALEALFAILSADRETSLEEILADAEKLLPEHVVEKMVGEAYDRLDRDAQMAMQALAIYGRPVSNVALDYLLQPHLNGVDSAKVLNRLVHMQFVRKESTRYYLHPVDREHAFSRIPEGEPGDKLVSQLAEIEPEAQSIFSQYALLDRGAQFFKETRLPRDDWKSLDDLAPQLAEFGLRFQSKDYDTAVGVLLEIDFHYLMLWGHSRLVVEYHERLKGKIEDDALKAASLGSLGLCYYSLSDYQKAIEHLQQSLDIAREIGNREGEGNSLGNLGLCYYSLGDYQKAIEHHQQSLDISREIGNREGEGYSLNNLGLCYSSLSDYQKAIERHQQSLDIVREIGNRHGEGISLGNLGNCYYRLGDYQKAIEHHQQSLDIAREIGNREGEGGSLGNLGVCYYSLSDYQKAIEHFQQHLDIAREIGDREGEGGSLGNLGNCYCSLGDYQKAIEHHQESLDIAREIGYRYGEGGSLKDLACALLFINDTDLAQVHLNTATEIWEEIGSPEVVEAYNVLGIACLKSGKYQEGQTNLEKALKQADAFLDQADRVETIDFKALALCGLAVCEQDRTHADEAREAFAQARAITKAKGMVDRILKFFDLIAELDEKNLLAGVREVAVGVKK